MLFAMIVAIGALAVLIFMLRQPSGEVLDRVAALDKASGVEQDKRSLYERLMDERRANELASRLLEAGWSNVAPRDMVRRSLAGLFAGAAIAVIAVMLLRVFNAGVFMLAACIAGYCAYRPYADLAAAIKKRKSAIRRTLPDFLDILATTVDAGVALNAALAAAAEQMTGPIREELDAALQDIRLGRSRAEALMAMAQRVREQDFTSVVVAIVQAERLGTGITGVLMELAIDTREKRFAGAEELAAQLPNKLVFPVGLCMMPALLLMIFGALFARLH